VILVGWDFGPIYIDAVTEIMGHAIHYQSTPLSYSSTKPTVEGDNLTGEDGPQLRTT
jgi:hypothetical protein